MKILILPILLSLSSYSYAQSCENKNITPTINFEIKKLEIDQSKSVAYLNSQNRNEKHYPIGMYMAPKSVEILPEYIRKKATFSNNVCAEIKSISFTFKMEPVIYLSREAQQFNCTYKRVYEHEMTHYKIEIDAINRLKPYFTSLIASHYAPAIQANDENSLSTQINTKGQQLIENIFKNITNQTEPYHAQLDTVENYNKESSTCSNMENIALSRLLRGSFGIDVLK